MLFGSLLACGVAVGQDGESRFAALSIEELTSIKITSVSRVEESLADAPASAFVITAEEIRRSGATSIAEALRLAPGVEVARRSAHAWSITIRGFNSDLANKLLVLIDGRSVYSPLYAGVFWDVQDLLLEDVARIEIIAGPGGTLWGANAVNGVISIITKSAAETDGGYLELGAGNEENVLGGFRYAGVLGDDIAARAYLKFSDSDSTKRLTGFDGVDDLRMVRSGFRLDWTSDRSDRFTVQGDAYSGDKAGEFLNDFSLGTLPDGTFFDRTEMDGYNVLARWERTLRSDSELYVQAYFDNTKRDIPGTYAETRDTLDLDVQHHLQVGDRNDVVWGIGFRDTRDALENSTFASFMPSRRRDRTTSAFFQDKIAVSAEKIFLTLGAKVEDNDYTGVEVQPNVRLSWLIDDRQSAWFAASRAVRIPSRLDSDLQLYVPASIPGVPFPVYVGVSGTEDFHEETLRSYEAGYRLRAGSRLSFDVSVFRNDYEDLQTQESRDPVIVLDPTAPYAILPNVLDNNMHGESSGGTFVANWQAAESWRLRFQYTRLDLELSVAETSTNANAALIAGSSPKHQAAVHSFADLSGKLTLYTGLRYVDALPSQGIESTIGVDVNLTWAPTENWQTSFAIRNLNDAIHQEFSQGGGNLIERSAYFRLMWLF